METMARMNSEAMIIDTSKLTREPMNSVAMTMQISSAPPVHRAMARWMNQVRRPSTAISDSADSRAEPCSSGSRPSRVRYLSTTRPSRFTSTDNNPATPVSRKTGATAIWMTWAVSDWAMLFATGNARDGVEIAAIIAAVTAPICAFGGYVFKAYNDSKEPS